MSCKSISRLPDAIILHILSFMDAKDAVRSGILLKRFAYLWTEAGCLNFQQSNMKFIDTTLYFHKLSNLENVSVIKCRNDGGDHDGEIAFGRLIRLLSLAGVKDFALEFSGVYCTLPQHFYSNSSLKKLELIDWNINPKGFINWKSLQSLCLSYMNMPNNIIYNVLSGCPSLELLELSECCGFTRINLTNNKCLRKLVIDSYKEAGGLEILAPNLQSLVLLDGIKVFNAKSLTHCHLDFYNDDELSNEDNAITMLTSLLGYLAHVKVVTIGEWVLQVLRLIELNGLQCPVSKTVKCLKLLTTLTTDDMGGIAWLLGSLNCLENLFIERWTYDHAYLPWFPRQDQMCQEVQSYWTYGNMKTEIDLKLKTVKFWYVKLDEELLHDQNEVLLLVEFLLRTANLMENMTIGAYGSELYFLKLSKKLLSLPRSSPRAIVKIIELE